MAITPTVYQQRPPEVTAVLWDKAADISDVASWCGGRVVDSITIQIPDVVDGDDGYLAICPCYIVKEGRRFLPMSVARFEGPEGYTKKTA